MFGRKHIGLEQFAVFKAERRPDNIHKVVVRNKFVVHRGNARSVYHKLLIKHRVVVSYIEISVIGKIAQRIFIALRIIIDDHFVVVGISVAALYVKIAGIAAFTVGRSVRQHEFVSFDFGIESLCVKAVEAAVPRVFTVVRLQLVLDAVERKSASADAVAVSPYQRSVIRARLIDIIFRQRVPHDNVPFFSAAVGSRKADYSRAVSKDIQFAAVVVGNAVYFVYLSVSFKFVNFGNHCSSPYDYFFG